MPKQLAFVGGWIKEVEAGDVEFVRRARKLYLSNHLTQQEFLSRFPAQSAGGGIGAVIECPLTVDSPTIRLQQRAQGEGG